MQIKCDYCGNSFSDTLSTCPHCGGVNDRVVRTAADQPLTIADLQKWYADRGLPPYETTRFFIGRDVKEPRAFGIYQDGRNFIVYKNKSDGTRAVRYCGEDEAYAVNELFQRLKQEILQQKSHQLGNTGVNVTTYKGVRQVGSADSGFVKKILLTAFAPFLVMLTMVMAMFVPDMIRDAKQPDAGYYVYQGMTYYHYWFDETWYRCPDLVSDNDDEWEQIYNIPEALQQKKTAKEYYLGEDAAVVAGYHASDWYDSAAYYDHNDYVSSGYFNYNDDTYYHMTTYADGDWYRWHDNGWHKEPTVPADLTRQKSAEDFYYTPTWDSSTQITDFENTEFYENYQKELAEAEAKAEAEAQNSNDDSSSYDWDSSSSWDSSTTDWGSDW